MTPRILFTLSAAALLAGCSNSYTPAAGTPPGKIYVDACSGCHNSVKQFALSANMANVEAVSAKIGKGGSSMPAFPNIQGEALAALSQYVVENSVRK